MATNPPCMDFIRDLPLYDTEKPFNLSFGTYNDGVATNVENESMAINLTDIRAHNTDLTYDRNGFQLVNLDGLPVLDGSEERTIDYLEAVRSFLLSEFRADRVICYDIRQRDSGLKRDPDVQEQHSDRYFSGTQVPAPPVYTCHIDHTSKGGFHRMKRHLNDDELATYLAEGWRARIVNVWRPLCRVTHAPLALCDLQTLSETDLLETDQVNTKYQGEIYSVKFNPSQRFYYASKQDVNEAWVMISFDSYDGQPLSHVKGCPHGAVRLPGHENSAGDERRSVEVRAIVLNKTNGNL